MNRLPTWLAGIYLLLFAVALVPIAMGGGALDSIFAVALGIPWTLLLPRLIETIAPTAFDSPVVGVTVIVACGLINATLIYVLTQWIVGALQRGKA